MSSAEDIRLLTASRSASSSEPHLEQSAPESGEVQASRSSPKPNSNANMIAHDVPVRVSGVLPGTSPGERELFTEETTSVLVGENGGVIHLSASVAPGQLLILFNLGSKRDVVAQVKRRRTYQPASCYVELEFPEPAPRFWGMEFSAASALLPISSKDAEAAALVMSAQAVGDERGAPPPAPTAEEVQALRREVEALREQPAAGATAAAISPPIEHDSVPMPFTAGAGSEAFVGLYQAAIAKAKRPHWARGSFTPGFREGVLRLTLLTTALVVTAAGAAWYKHWIPWKSAGKKSVSSPATGVNAGTKFPRESRDVAAHPEFLNTKVESGPPLTSSMPSRVPETPAQPFASSGSTPSPDASRASAPASMSAARPATIGPTTKARSGPVVASTMESALVPPKLIKSVRAVASLDALHDFETGNVVIEAVVGTAGEVHFIRVISGPPSLRASAVDAVKQYEYEPATQNGQPVPAHVNITIRFRFES